MKFGRLEDISHVDFRLPEEPKGNVDILSNYHENDTCQVYVGSTGWSKKEWKGKWYPEKTKTTDFLHAYGNQFNSIELNTTYYRVPKEDQIIAWKESVPEDFKFCPKVVKWISHKKDLGAGGDELTEMIDRFVLLEEKLGSFFMQLPPHFSTDKYDVLAHFLQGFPKAIELSIELRHESWFENEDAKKKLQDLIYESGHNILITDVSGRRDVAHMLVTNDYMMVRWVGNGLVPTDYTRLDEWVDRLTAYKKNGIKKVYFFPHEPEAIQPPQITHYFCTKLMETGHFNVRGPKPIALQPNLFDI